MTRAASPIPAITLLLLAGVLAGTQLGKIAPLIPWYRDELGFSLVFIGWLTSAIGIFVALAALPTSLAVDRVGQFRIFAGGALVLTISGLGLALFDDPAVILLARVIEAAGYLVLVIVIPAILNTVSPSHLKAPVLAIWGGFVPVGFAIADFMALAMVPELGPRVYLFGSSALFGLLALAAALLLLRLDARSLAPVSGEAAPRLTDALSAPVILVAIAFGFYVILSIGFFTFLPAAAVRDGATLLVSAGLVALLVPAGNALASLAMRGRELRAAALLSVGGFAVSAAAAVPAFVSGDPIVATLAAGLFAIAGGVTASALFASVPFIVPGQGSASVVIGVICQAGGIATLFGPPLAGYVIEGYGWAALGWFLLAASLAGLLCLVPLLPRRRQQPA